MLQFVPVGSGSVYGHNDWYLVVLSQWIVVLVNYLMALSQYRSVSYLVLQSQFRAVLVGTLWYCFL